LIADRAGPRQLVAWSTGKPTSPPQEKPATFLVGSTSYSYPVTRGDTLSAIARDWLGDADRWPEICKLNWHRHWSGLAGRLTDCNLIYPGWTLNLPEDAVPPPPAAEAPATEAPATEAPATEAPATEAPTTVDDAPPGDQHPAPHPSTPSTPDLPMTSPPAPEVTGPSATSWQTSDADPDIVRVPASPSPSPTTTGSPDSTPTATGAPPGADAGPQAPTPATPPGSGHGDNGSTLDGPTETSEPAPVHADRDGVTIPGGFLPWSLAGSVAAALAMVWLQRRRHHRPDSTDDDPADLPPPIVDVHRQVARRHFLSTSTSSPTPDDPPDGPIQAPVVDLADLADRAAHVPDQQAFPPGGIGLAGEGAQAAARAALAAVLSSGGPRDPDKRGEAIIDGATLTTLIGVDAAGLGAWPRLHVADDLDHALALVEDLLMHRSRILDDHTVTDLLALRRRAPDEEPLPPVLLITESPAAGSRMRVKTDLALGAGLDVTGILLGTWAHGITLHVDTDGHTRAADDAPLPDGTPTRVGVLGPDTAVAILATLREAHTGHRPAFTITTESTVRHAPPEPTDLPTPAPTPPAAVPDTGADADSDADAADAAARVVGEGMAASAMKARLRVLGPPEVLDLTEGGKPLRSKAAELAVFLACHPDGADTRVIGEHLEPGVRLRSADVRVHTNVSNLRHVFGRAAGPRKLGYVTKAHSRYRLDPVSVDVDLWNLRDLVARARTAPTGRRIELLRSACALYTAPLADGCDYDWIEPHREKVRQQTSDAHLLLAEALLETGQPADAVHLLDHAIRLDRYNEELYRVAMRARHAVGDLDGIRHLVRALTVALADLDVEPDDDTVALAQQLRRPTAHHPERD
jgi:DNA-binding SARP family transcriptional activator